MDFLQSNYMRLLLVASLFGISALTLPTLALSKNETSESGKKVITIPVKVASSYYVTKKVEKVPERLPVEVSYGISASKVGLVYPKEIFKPEEHIREDKSFLSCGRADDKTIYAKGVKAFNRGELLKAEGYFLRLIREYPQSPFSIKARYYLGYIAFVKGNYLKAYKIFKELCHSPYPFEWKKFACYNALIAGLYIGKHDYSVAKTDFWKNYLNWLDGKLDDLTFYQILDCIKVEEPYRTYCLYLKEFLKPTGEVNFPAHYLRSLEVRKLLLSFLSGRTGRFSPTDMDRYISDPKYGKDFEFFYTYYLINRGEYAEAFRYIVDLKKKDYKKALKLAEILASLSPQYAAKLAGIFQTPELWTIYVRQLYNLGNYSEVLKFAPSLSLYREAGYAAYRLGDYGRAARYLEMVPDKNETDYRILFDSLLRVRDWQSFRKVLSEVKTRFPDLYREYLGWYYYERKNWNRAATLLRDPFYRAVAYFNAGNYRAALRLLSSLNTPEAKILKAKIYLAEGKFNKALNTLTGVEGTEADYLRGLAHFAEGNYREAAYYFGKLLNKVSRYPDALLRLADSYYNLGRYDLAKHYYLEFIRLFKGSPLEKNAYIGLVNVYLQTGDPVLADILYKVIQKNPSLGGDELKLKLAEGLVKNGKVRQAQTLLKELLSSRNSYYRGKALLLLAKLEPERRETYLKEALKIEEPQIRSAAAVELAQFYLSKGDRERALRVLVKYQKDITDVGELIDLYTRLKAFDRLYYLLAELIAADNRYTLEAFKIAEKYHRPEFYKLALHSLDAKIAAEAAYRLEKYYLNKKDLKEALKYALFLKINGLKVEPTYSKALFEAAKALQKEGYLKDACDLVKEVNSKYLSTSEKLFLENMKVSCSQ